MISKDLYSVIIPVFNSESTLNELVNRIQKHFLVEKKGCEIILVNDGSTDTSDTICKQLTHQHSNIIYIRLKRNLGQHKAVLCGIHYSSGDYFITLDDDLQNPPEEISKLIVKMKEGYDVVFGRYKKKKHSLIRNMGSKLIGLLNKILFQKPDDLVISNFRLFKRSVADKMLSHEFRYPYIPGMLLMAAEHVTNVETLHESRQKGISGYSFSKLLLLTCHILLLGIFKQKSHWLSDGKLNVLEEILLYEA